MDLFHISLLRQKDHRLCLPNHHGSSIKKETQFHSVNFTRLPYTSLHRGGTHQRKIICHIYNVHLSLLLFFQVSSRNYFFIFSALLTIWQCIESGNVSELRYSEFRKTSPFSMSFPWVIPQIYTCCILDFHKADGFCKCFWSKARLRKWQWLLHAVLQLKFWTKELTI